MTKTRIVPLTPWSDIMIDIEDDGPLVVNELRHTVRSLGPRLTRAEEERLAQIWKFDDLPPRR